MTAKEIDRLRKERELDRQAEKEGTAISRMKIMRLRTKVGLQLKYQTNLRG